MNLRILVSVPAIPFSWVKDYDLFKDSFNLDPVEFEPTDYDLGCFTELRMDPAPKKLVGINIPHFPLAENKATGVAGPGHPAEELFVPAGLERNMKRLCGSYDKWRPYPADELTSYAQKMAKRFCKKRVKIFEEANDAMSWEVLVYAEHAPASLAHLCKASAMEVAKEVFSSAIRVSKSWPGVPLVLFSPYGTGKEPGFVVSNMLDGTDINNWEGIRSVFHGTGTK